MEDQEMSICETCTKFIDYKNKLLEESDSIFDMFFDINSFIEQCRKTCREDR